MRYGRPVCSVVPSGQAPNPHSGAPRTIPKSAEAVQALWMRAGIILNVTRAGRRRLEAIVADRSASQKQVWRAKIILATADG